MTTTPTEHAKDVAAAALKLAEAIGDAESVRWERPPRPKADSVRSSGAISDPTSATALDELRLDLSEASRTAENLLRGARLALQNAHAALIRSLDAYQGD